MELRYWNMSKRLIALSVAAAFVLGACSLPFAATSLAIPSLPAAQAAATPAPTATVGPETAAPAVTTLSLQSFQSTLEDIYQRVDPSVVLISVVEQATQPSSPSSPFPFFSPPAPQAPQTQQALGSGFVWDKQGDIVTNNHVVAGASQITVTFYDGTTVDATVVGADTNSDLAVVRVHVPGGSLQPVVLADSAQIKVGQVAIAIGNPFGEENTMTTGIISAVGRTLPVSGSSSNSPTYSIPDVIQTDAPINPGNSGGVLLDDQGRVIGVTSAIESPVRASSGIGFAIPSDIVRRVVPALIQSGHYAHPYLGISGISLSPDLAKAMNLDPSTRGALVETVASGGPADQAGLQASTRQVTILGQQIAVGGDVIVSVNAQPVKTMDDLIAYLEDSTGVGQTLTLGVLRGGKQVSLNATLGTRPASQSQPSAAASAQGARLGILGITLTSGIDQAMALPANQQGVLVESVQTGSPADQAGLRASSSSAMVNGQQVQIGGDVIVAIDGQTVGGLEDLQSYLQQQTPGDQATLTVLRNGNQVQLQVTLGSPAS
jgi:S1-C subfamily serine protease